MKLASERPVGFWTPRPPALDAVLERLESLSLRPEFARQRELALRRALKPYLEGEAGRIVPPLEQETELASLALFCDFYPEDGQLTLIEQLRDVVTEPIPGEERVWLDPLKHSYLDLLEPVGTPTPREDLTLRSLGDGRRFVVPGGEFAKDIAAGQALLTRVIRAPDAGESDKAVWGGCGVVLSIGGAEALLEMTTEWRREMEVSSGSFALGEWQEFAKRFGYLELWALAQLRMSAVVDAVVQIRYRCPNGQPYLYVVALYDHSEYRVFVERLSELSEFEPEPAGPASGDGSVVRRWAQREQGGVVARLTLTSSQLIVECDSPERLDQIKHRLAALFGFSLHFRGETVTPPARRLSVEDLMSEHPLTLVVTPDEDRTLLDQFLEKAYLEWSDQPHPALGGLTPRHAAASPSMRGRVSALIEELARHDLGLSRTGRASFDYNRLRAHVGLHEGPP
jgi:hypothetical protein